MKSIYKNNGKRWSDDEDTQLLQELNKKNDIETISMNYNRSITAIKAHIYLKVVDDHKNGVEKELIFERYNFNEETLKDALVYVQKIESKKISEKGEKEVIKEKVKKEKVKKEEVKKEEEVIKEEVIKENENTLLLKELILEVREMKLLMKEFISNFNY